MVTPERPTRRPRQSEQVIDLRQAAATRNRVADGPDAVPGLGGTRPRRGRPRAARRRAPARRSRAAARPARAGPARRLARAAPARGRRRGPPAVPRAFDERGERVDRIHTHPGWAGLQRDGVEAGLGGTPWASTEAHAHLARAAGLLLWAQTSGSSALALSTHHAAAAAVAGTAAAGAWLPRLATRRPVAGSRRAAAGPRRDRRGRRHRAHLLGPGRRCPATTATRTWAARWRAGPRGACTGASGSSATPTPTSSSPRPPPATAPACSSPPPAVGRRPNAVQVLRLRPGASYRAWVVGDLALEGAWAVRLDGPGPAARPGRAPGPAAPRRRPAAPPRWRRCWPPAPRRRRAGGGGCGRLLPGGAPRPPPGRPRRPAGHRADGADRARRRGRGVRGRDRAGPAARRGHHGRRRRAASGPARRAPRPPGPRPCCAWPAPSRRLWLSRRAPQVALEAVECLGSAGWDDVGDLARVHRDAGAVLAGRTGHGLALEVVRVVADDPDGGRGLRGRVRALPRQHPRLDRPSTPARTCCARRRRRPGRTSRPCRAPPAGSWSGSPSPCRPRWWCALPGTRGGGVPGRPAGRLGRRGLGALPLGTHQTALVLDRALSDV